MSGYDQDVQEPVRNPRMFPMQYPNVSSARPSVQHSNQTRNPEAPPVQLFHSHRNAESPSDEAADSQRSRIFRMQQERLRMYGRVTTQRPTDADALIQDIFKKEDIVKPSDLTRTVAGFPQWCFVESKIPRAYTTVEKLASKEGRLDTSLLYPLLLSSGLHKTVLGHIWFLVNQTVPGILQSHELYAALALVALAQKGRPCNRLDVLNQFSVPPVPFLQLPQDTMPAPSFVTDVSSVSFLACDALSSHAEPLSLISSQSSFAAPTCSSNTTSGTNDDEFAEFLSGSKSDSAPAAKAISTGNSAVGNRLANYAKMMKKVTVPSTDECSQSDEEFADFQQAKENNVEPDHSLVKSEGKTSDDVSDKYSVFREMDQELHEKNKVHEEEEFGDYHTNHDRPEEMSSIKISPESDSSRSTTLLDKWSITDSKKMDVDKEISQFSCEMSFDLLKKQATSYVPSIQLDPFSKDDGEEFGDFVSPLEIQDDLLLASPKDCGIVENQSVSSLEFSPVENDGEVVNDTVSHGSVSSLDKMTIGSTDFGQQPDAPERDGSFKILQENEVSWPNEDPKCVGSLLEAANRGCAFGLDRYTLINNEINSDHERNLREWAICLESCKRFVKDARNICKDISSQTVCAEVVASEEGCNYFTNVTEIYKLARRLHSTAQLTASRNEQISQLVEEIDQMWHEIKEMVPLSPELDDCNINTIEVDAEIACGICLKNVSNVSSPLHETYKLTYGGRQYHTTCANFWVNCVNSLLPALSFPHLL